MRLSIVLTKLKDTLENGATNRRTFTSRAGRAKGRRVQDALLTRATISSTQAVEALASPRTDPEAQALGSLVDVKKGPSVSAQLAAKRGECTKLREQLRLKDARITEQGKYISKRDKDFKELVKAKTKHLSAGTIAADDHHLVVGKLRGIVDSWRRWAKKWSMPAEQMQQLSADDKAELVKYLCQHPRILSEYGRVAIFKAAYGSEVVLGAVLSHFILLRIIQKPFFFFGKESRIKGPKNLENTMEWLMNLPVEVSVTPFYCGF